MQPTRCGQANGSLLIFASGASLQYSLDNLTFQSTPAFSNLPSASYTINVKNAKGCMATGSAEIQASSGPQIDQLITEPTTCGAANGKLMIQASGQGNLSYTLNGGAFQSQSSFVDLTQGTYELEVRDSQSCSLKRTITVTDDCQFNVFMPDAFTPNGDGKNDGLEIKSNFSGAIELAIFNRWGEIVFQTKKAKEERWDGTYRGVAVVNGAIDYII